MHCPECKALNEASAAACSTCGLLLLNLQKPVEKKRRSEDFAVEKRRASDKSETPCRFCGGMIPANAIRCKHCSEVLDEDFYRERAQRLRSRVNYASWVAYLFGLGALLVFKPVGVVSIAAGLLLSIAYYAIPVEPPSTPRNPKKSTIWEILKRQLKMERVSIPIPAFRTKRLIFVGTPLIAAIIGYSANALLLQQPVNDILKEDAALSGMKVTAHYKYWVIPGVVEYNLQELTVRQTPLDVHMTFLKFAKKLKEKRYSRVDLSYRGVTKFSIDGASFTRLGEEYSKRNFDYVLYSFPKLAQPATGTTPMTPADSDRDALLEFHRRWYGQDQLTKTVHNGF
jgi:predicted nucleic acid-binding Zn ribbon protein